MFKHTNANPFIMSVVRMSTTEASLSCNWNLCIQVSSNLYMTICVYHSNWAHLTCFCGKTRKRNDILLHWFSQNFLFMNRFCNKYLKIFFFFLKYTPDRTNLCQWVNDNIYWCSQIDTLEFFVYSFTSSNVNTRGDKTRGVVFSDDISY